MVPTSFGYSQDSAICGLASLLFQFGWSAQKKMFIYTCVFIKTLNIKQLSFIVYAEIH